MVSFAERLTEAVTQAEAAAESQQTARLLGVLDELVFGLRKMRIGADLSKSGSGTRVMLWVFPRYRPARASALLSFAIEEGGIRVLSTSPRTFTEPAELESWPLAFVTSAEFRETLHVLHEQADQPVEGRLRTSAESAFAQGDMAVALSADQQEKLDLAGDLPVDEGISVEVARIDFGSNGVFSGATKYLLLESAGLVMDVVEVSEKADHLVVRGKRRPSGPRLAGALRRIKTAAAPRRCPSRTPPRARASRWPRPAPRAPVRRARCLRRRARRHRASPRGAGPPSASRPPPRRARPCARRRG